ncbi:hypothetical protein ACKFRT_08940 [Corynebacterium sp. YSMAA1_1_F7]|uniref:hypothetical protein n=1 Tax=Corynebacterium sp. YSMAA1_1_F7 TaxID=3383590 RepID=UPI0038D1E474
MAEHGRFEGASSRPHDQGNPYVGRATQGDGHVGRASQGDGHVGRASQEDGHAREAGKPRQGKFRGRGGTVAGIVVGAAVLAVTGGLVMGQIAGKGGVEKEGSAASHVATSQETTAPAEPPSDEEQQERLDALAAKIAKKKNVKVGVAILGQDGPLHAGSLNEEGAWSTIKVPIAGAAEEKLRRAEARGRPAPRAAMEADMDAAIHYSDNDAAFRLWMYVGDGSDRTAAYKVRDYMHRVGDPTNAAKQFEDGVYIGFGAIKWKLTDQVRFMDGFRCSKGSGPVLERMEHIIPEHSYGLAKIKGAQFKGGWGPEPDGRFIYRQLGLVPGPDGKMTPVAIMVVPNNGFEPTAWEGMDALGKELPDLLQDAQPAKAEGDC